MAELRTLQPSFTAGELSPALGARVDLSKYASGLSTALNVFIHPHGGASNRAGTQFLNAVKNSAHTTTLIPFQFNTEQSYILEFGNLYMRVYRDGGVVLSGPTPYELVTPYAHGDVDDLVYIQEADVMYIVHPDYEPRKLSRLADDNWTLTTVAFAPKTAIPTGLAVFANYQRKNGTTATFEIKVTAVGPGGEQSAASGSITQSVQDQYEDGRTYKITWNTVPGAASYRLYRVNAVSSTGLLIETTTNEAVLEQMSIHGGGAIAPVSADPGAPATPTGLAFQTLWGKEMKYKVSAVDAATGEESLPTNAVTVTNNLTYKSNKNTLTWNAVAGASAYLIYKESNGAYGYIGRVETTSFIDENITADISDGPQLARNPFVGAGNYPRCATFIEQRLALAATRNDPQAVWMSQSANYENFGVSSPAKASDAVTFRLRARQVNEVRSMLATRGLMILTSGAEWIVNGGGNSDAIAPAAIRIENQGYRGAAKVQPIVVGNTVLFAQARGGVVRDFSYQITDDGFSGKDLTILSRHLFEGREIKSWAYAQAPYSIAWVVLDDGSLVSLTYLKEHEVWAWTRHSSGANARFEAVAVISEGQEDVPHFIVRRTVDGSDRRYIERLHTRVCSNSEDGFFVDCGLTYEGGEATVMSGLDHLEGQTVVALANGNVVRDLVVEDGEVTLPNPATKVHVGLPMVSAIATLNLDLGQVAGLGTVQGRKKSISDVLLRVEKTRGIFTGPDDGDRNSKHLVEYRQRQHEAWDEAVQLYTGDILINIPWDWNDNGRMWVKQFDPLPMTILGIMPDVTLGR